MAEINDQMQSILLKQILNTKLPEEQEDQGALSLSSLGVKTLDDEVSEYSKAEAISFAGERGILDTYHGVKQLMGIDNLSQKYEQRKLNKLMNHPEWGGQVKAAWMAGMILDPAGWLVPVAKARTVGKLAWHGAKWGGISGYLGYVDEDSNDRLIQAAGGAVGGAVLSPLIGVGVRKAISSIRGQQGETISEFANSKSSQELLDNPTSTKSQFTGSKPETLNSSVKKFFISPFQSGKEKYNEFNQKFLYKPVFDNPIPTMVGTAGFVAGQEIINRIDEERDIDTGPLTQTMISLLSGAAFAFGTKKAIKTKGGSKVADYFGRRVLENYRINPEYKTLKDDAGFAFHSIENQFLDITRRAQNLTEDESKILYQFLDGQVGSRDIVGKVSKEAHELGEESKQLIKDTGQQMVDAGLLNPEDYAKNLDAYIHRTYLKPLARRLKSQQEQDFVKQEVKNNLGIIGSELKARGQIVSINTKIDPSTGKMFDQNEHDELLAKGWEKFREDPDSNNILLRKDYSPTQRKAMGEIEDAGFAIMSTGRLMLNDLATYKLYARIKDNTKLSLDEGAYRKLTEAEQGTYKQIPSDKFLKGTGKEVNKYGSLAGMWVKKDVADDLIVARKYMDKEELFSNIFNSRGFRRYRKYNSMWKRTKTSWNPTVHANNLISNFVLMDLHDIQMKHMIKGLNVWTKKGQERLMNDPVYGNVYDDLLNFGVFDSSLAKTDLGLGMGDIKRLYEKKLNISINDIDGLIDASSTISGTIWNRIKNPLRVGKRIIAGADTKVTNWYQMEDQMFRIAMYLDRLEKRMPELNKLKKGTNAYENQLLKIKKESALESKKGFIDYNIQAPWVQRARDTAVPFIAYTYGIIPILAKTATTKPHKFAKWAAIGYAINYAGQERSKSDEESERAIMVEREKSDIFGLNFMPPSFLKLPDSWNQAFTLGLDRDPFTGKSMPSRSLYLDTTRWIPGGDVLGQTSENGRLIPGLPAPFQPSFGMIGEIVGPLMFGVDPFTGKQDDRDYGVDWENTKFMLQRLIPNNPLIGLSIYQKAVGADSRWTEFDSRSVEKIMGALESKEKVSSYSADLPVLMAIAQTVGIKLWPFERDIKLRTFTAEQKKHVRELRKTIEEMQEKLDEYPSGSPQYNKIRQDIEEEWKELLSEEYKFQQKYFKAIRK